MSTLRTLLCSLVLAGSPAWAATLESPSQGATLSGIGFISGWKCDAGDITVTINTHGPFVAASGMSRADTASACGGASDNGFVLPMNWAILGDGKQTVVAYDDGVEFARQTFSVVTAGEEFLPDAAGECVVPDFPAPGENASFAWNTSTQHLELTDVGPHVPAPGGAQHLFDGTWDFTLTLDGTCDTPPGARYGIPLIQSGLYSNKGTLTGAVVVHETGLIVGRFRDMATLNIVSFNGFLTGNVGTGAWFNFVGCQGDWTAQLRTQ